MSQSAPTLLDDSDETVGQLLLNKAEATTRETVESVVEELVLVELRGMRSQMARLQMQMEEIVVHDVGDMESPPMYNQVTSRRGANSS